MTWVTRWEEFVATSKFDYHERKDATSEPGESKRDFIERMVEELRGRTTEFEVFARGGIGMSTKVRIRYDHATTSSPKPQGPENTVERQSGSSWPRGIIYLKDRLGRCWRVQ